METLKQFFMILEMCFVIAQHTSQQIPTDPGSCLDRAWADESRERQIPGSEKFSLEHCLGEPVKAVSWWSIACGWVDVALFFWWSCWEFMFFLLNGLKEEAVVVEVEVIPKEDNIFSDMRLGKNKCDWCSCIAECAVGVGLVHPLLHRIRERNGNELQEGDMCKRWRLWRFVFSNNPCLETSWISGGVIWGRRENSRELSHVPPGESRKIWKIMDSKKYRRKGWGICCLFSSRRIYVARFFWKSWGYTLDLQVL